MAQKTARPRLSAADVRLLRKALEHLAETTKTPGELDDVSWLEARISGTAQAAFGYQAVFGEPVELYSFPC